MTGESHVGSYNPLLCDYSEDCFFAARKLL